MKRPPVRGAAKAAKAAALAMEHPAPPPPPPKSQKAAAAAAAAAFDGGADGEEAYGFRSLPLVQDCGGDIDAMGSQPSFDYDLDTTGALSMEGGLCGHSMVPLEMYAQEMGTSECQWFQVSEPHMYSGDYGEYYLAMPVNSWYLQDDAAAVQGMDGFAVGGTAAATEDAAFPTALGRRVFAELGNSSMAEAAAQVDAAAHGKTRRSGPLKRLENKKIQRPGSVSDDSVASRLSAAATAAARSAAADVDEVDESANSEEPGSEWRLPDLRDRVGPHGLLPEDSSRTLEALSLRPPSSGVGAALQSAHPSILDDANMRMIASGAGGEAVRSRFAERCRPPALADAAADTEAKGDGDRGCLAGVVSDSDLEATRHRKAARFAAKSAQQQQHQQTKHQHQQQHSQLADDDVQVAQADAPAPSPALIKISALPKAAVDAPAFVPSSEVAKAAAAAAAAAAEGGDLSSSAVNNYVGSQQLQRRRLRGEAPAAMPVSELLKWRSLAAPADTVSRGLRAFADYRSISSRCTAAPAMAPPSELNGPWGVRWPATPTGASGRGGGRTPSKQQLKPQTPQGSWRSGPSPTPTAAAAPRRKVRAALGELEELERSVLLLLNKICPENLTKIVEQLSALRIESPDALECVIRTLFSKALNEPHYCGTYADAVYALCARFPEFEPTAEGHKPVTFRRVLLSVVQAEFESLPTKLEMAQAAERGAASGEDAQTAVIRRKALLLANMKFIGHLYLRRMISTKVVDLVVHDLIGDASEGRGVRDGGCCGMPEDHCVECACELLEAVGHTLDGTTDGRALMSKYETRLSGLLDRSQREQRRPEGPPLSRRVQFQVQGLIELRSKGWVRKLFREQAKTLADVRRDGVRRGGSAFELKATGIRPSYVPAEAPQTPTEARVITAKETVKPMSLTSTSMRPSPPSSTATTTTSANSTPRSVTATPTSAVQASPAQGHRQFWNSALVASSPVSSSPARSPPRSPPRADVASAPAKAVVAEEVGQAASKGVPTVQHGMSAAGAYGGSWDKAKVRRLLEYFGEDRDSAALVHDWRAVGAPESAEGSEELVLWALQVGADGGRKACICAAAMGELLAAELISWEALLDALDTFLTSLEDLLLDLPSAGGVVEQLLLAAVASPRLQAAVAATEGSQALNDILRIMERSCGASVSRRLLSGALDDAQHSARDDSADRRLREALERFREPSESSDRDSEGGPARERRDGEDSDESSA